MSKCATCSFDPCQCGQGGFTTVSDMDVERTLIRSLAGCVDRIRDLYTCLGARAYEVVLVRTRWSGGRRGEGVEEVISEEVILPTPLVSDLTALVTDVQPLGTAEEGIITVSQISPRFTEDQLTGVGNDGQPIPRDEQFYWEIRLPRADGNGIRRRFVPTTAPNLDPLKFEWTIQLEKSYDDRTRSGDV